MINIVGEATKYSIEDVELQLFGYEVTKRNIPIPIEVSEKDFNDFVTNNNLLRSKENFILGVVFDDEFGNHCAEYGGASGVCYLINPSLLFMGQKSKSKIEDIKTKYPIGKKTKVKEFSL